MLSLHSDMQTLHPCSWKFRSILWVPWLFIVIVTATCIVRFKSADDEYNTRIIADCFYERSINVSTTQHSAWSYIDPTTGAVQTVTRIGADTSISPVTCYVGDDPAEVMFDWEIPDRRRSRVIWVEAMLVLLLITTAVVSMLRCPNCQRSPAQEEPLNAIKMASFPTLSRPLLG